MFNLEGLIPKLCKIGQQLRGDDEGLRLRSAALQALASMVRHFFFQNCSYEWYKVFIAYILARLHCYNLKVFRSNMYITFSL